MLAKAALSLDTRLNAIERSPLPAGRSLAHCINKLLLIEHFDHLIVLARLLLVLPVALVCLAWHNRCGRGSLSHRVN